MSTRQSRPVSCAAKRLQPASPHLTTVAGGGAGPAQGLEFMGGCSPTQPPVASGP